MRQREQFSHRAGKLKTAALLALALVAGGVAVLIAVVDPGGAAEAIPLLSSRSCLECHPGVAAEWQASHHAFAFENPEVRKLSNEFANEECLACHAPRPVLAFAPGERVLARGAERGLGVDCLACHGLPDGDGVATANPDPRSGAPCRPRTVPRMASVEHCASCHNQHGTVDQWRAAPAEFGGSALRGEGCLHCHMPEQRRSGGRVGADHAFRAAHDVAALQAAVEFDGGWDPAQAWVEVRNVAAAHNFPTDERSRAADVQVRWRGEDGAWGEWQHVWRLRDPYRDEVELTNTQLPAGETWRELLPVPEGSREGEVRLMYRTNPFQPDAEAAELHRVPLRP
ncbi:MAG TPA: multiheme c-type cytochrome [Planctomycetota bacterium]